MTFVTSRSTVDALMGPSIRTQTTSVNASPRQRRAQSSGLRSASAPNLLIPTDLTNAPTRPTDVADSEGAASCGSNTPTQGVFHPQDQFAQLQHFANFTPTSLHSNLGMRFNLAPVIESGLSPAEEKAEQDSFNFSMPARRRSKRKSQALAHLASQSVPNLVEPDRLQGSRPPAALLREQVVHTHSPYSSLRSTTTSVPNLPHMHVVLRNMHDDLSMADTDFDPHGIHQPESSPELTCSSSLSSEEDSASRTSLSSNSSIEDLAVVLTEDEFLSVETIGVADYERPHPYATQLNIDTTNRVNIVSTDKISRLLGTTCPKHDAAVFESAPQSATSSKNQRSQSICHTNVNSSKDAQVKSVFGKFKTGHLKSWPRRW